MREVRYEDVINYIKLAHPTDEFCCYDLVYPLFNIEKPTMTETWHDFWVQTSVICRHLSRMEKDNLIECTSVGMNAYGYRLAEAAV
jgi:hypothetical protein